MPVTTADYSKVDKARSSRTPWLRMMKHPAVWAIVVRTVLGQRSRPTAALHADTIPPVHVKSMVQVTHSGCTVWQHGCCRSHTRLEWRASMMLR